RSAASSCARTTTCSARASTTPAWRRASAGPSPTSAARSSTPGTAATTACVTSTTGCDDPWRSTSARRAGAGGRGGHQGTRGAPGDALNHRGRVYQQLDGAGAVTHLAYDFKGNPLTAGRQLAVEYKQALDWTGAVALEPQTWQSATVYDALNRPLQLVTPHDG